MNSYSLSTISYSPPFVCLNTNPLKQEFLKNSVNNKSPPRWPRFCVAWLVDFSPTKLSHNDVDDHVCVCGVVGC